MRPESFIGFGNVPSLTFRQSVGAENGSGAPISGRLGFWTSCDSRIKALSGRASNEDIATPFVEAPILFSSTFFN